mmetsp:Transcript_35301/g.85610  ORF Transcript_35301/g.85610 Transcript_35301/m.85610 type:complete len:141 (+) Transcript_35301:1296-1718(+)
MVSIRAASAIFLLLQLDLTLALLHQNSVVHSLFLKDHQVSVHRPKVVCLRSAAVDDNGEVVVKEINHWDNPAWMMTPVSTNGWRLCGNDMKEPSNRHFHIIKSKAWNSCTFAGHEMERYGAGMKNIRRPSSSTSNTVMSG